MPRVQLGAEVGTLLWDLDNTFIDSVGVFRAVLAEILPSYNIGVPTRMLVEANYHGSLRDTFQGTLGALGEQELDAIECDFVAAQEPLYESAAAHSFLMLLPCVLTRVVNNRSL